MRPKYLGLAAAALASVLTSAAAHAQKKIAIVDAEVFDATGAAPYVATVVISNGMIESVEKGGKAPRGAEVIKGKGLALVPGFYDLHVHYSAGGQPQYAPQISHAYMKTGVTTVVDMAIAPEEFAPRREWYKDFPAPNIIYAARMSTLGGHGATWSDQNRTKWVNTPYAATQAVRELVPYKPDAIKGFMDGWRYGSGIDETSMDEVTLTALVKEAHANNLPVLTHTVTIERGKIAARAGVDVIAHAMQDKPHDQELIDLLVKSGTAYAPTLALYEPSKPGRPALAPDSPGFQARMKRYDDVLAGVKALHDAGVPIALGTDAGMPGTPHGSSSLRELELFVRAGLTPSEALIAGTANSAKSVGHDDRGTIAPGKRADMVLIKGKPWENIADVYNVDTTFIGGKIGFGKGAPKPLDVTMPKAVVPSALVADFERPDGRTAAGALPVGELDSGLERSTLQMNVVSTPESGRFLSVSSRMGRRADPRAAAVLPLNPGSLQPADLRSFTGVKFSLRGEGKYGLTLNGQSARWGTTFDAGSNTWSTHSIPFSSLTSADDDAVWTGLDVLELAFSIEKLGGQQGWMEIDNVTFY
jgi:imidazolonepropionase-like amidohydrolase